MKTNDLLITRPTKAVPYWGIHQMEKTGNVTVISQGEAGFTRKEVEKRAIELALPFRSAIYIQTKRGNRVPLVPAHIMELQAQLYETEMQMHRNGVRINLEPSYRVSGTVTGRITPSINHIEFVDREKQ